MRTKHVTLLLWGCNLKAFKTLCLGLGEQRTISMKALEIVICITVTWHFKKHLIDVSPMCSFFIGTTQHNSKHTWTLNKCLWLRIA